MDKNKNVIQIIDSLHAGGAEMMAVNIANALSSTGIASHLCTTRLEGDLKLKLNDAVGYLFLNKRHTFDIRALKQLLRYINTNKITIIHAHSSSYFIAILAKFLKPSLKIIWHDHYGKSNDLKNRKYQSLNIASSFFSHIISVNKLLANWAETHLRTKKISYLPNFAILNTNLKKTVLKGAPNYRIICLANFRPQKDHLTLLKAFKNVIKHHPKWSLHLVGEVIESDYSKRISGYIKDNLLEKHVFVYGSCPDIGNVLSQASIGVLSSKSEGLPVSLLEYGLAKLPVVITQVGECASVLNNGENGILVPPEDSGKFEDALKELINSKELRQQFSVNLNQTVREKYSKDSFITQLLKIYELE
ncbi:glycosyltransferase [Lutibacter sp.]